MQHEFGLNRNLSPLMMSFFKRNLVEEFDLLFFLLSSLRRWLMILPLALLQSIGTGNQLQWENMNQKKTLFSIFHLYRLVQCIKQNYHCSVCKAKLPLFIYVCNNSITILPKYRNYSQL